MLLKEAIRTIKRYSRPYVFGMIHMPALPGSVVLPLHAFQKKKALEKSGGKGDGIIAENMHDVPYIKQPVGPEIVSSMTIILAAANKEALAVARCTGNIVFRSSSRANQMWIENDLMAPLG
uniref:Uncharacterized protein n=1 Tax=Angiostrongylus cantonensis TaxID=6313 RepID=A0A0K0DQN4_ANGCA